MTISGIGIYHVKQWSRSLQMNVFIYSSVHLVFEFFSTWAKCYRGQFGICLIVPGSQVGAEEGLED